MKRILVTGGAGFVGSHLCEKLINEGNEVFCVDNFYTGSIDNIQHLQDSPKFHLIIADISKPINFCSRLDEIYNLACPASPPHYQRDPVHTVKTSVIGTLQMLELAKETGAKFLQASTSEIYGDPAVHPQVEEYWGNVNPIGVRSCYDEGKRVAETLCFDFLRQYNVDIKVVRIFNTYGPNMDKNDGRIISNFITQALKNEKITVYGDGSQSRSFQYITDLISGMATLMKSDLHGPYNIGNPDEYNMNEVAKIIIDATGSSSEIVHQELPKDDPKRRRPEISKSRKDLGWSPKTGFRDGINQTVEFFKKILDV